MSYLPTLQCSQANRSFLTPITALFLPNLPNLVDFQQDRCPPFDSNFPPISLSSAHYFWHHLTLSAICRSLGAPFRPSASHSSDLALSSPAIFSDLSFLDQEPKFYFLIRPRLVDQLWTQELESRDWGQNHEFFSHRPSYKPPTFKVFRPAS